LILLGSLTNTLTAGSLDDGVLAGIDFFAIRVVEWRHFDPALSKLARDWAWRAGNSLI
jgi:hypothetical protein